MDSRTRLMALLMVLQRMLAEVGLDRSVLPRGRRRRVADVGPALDSFSTRALATTCARHTDDGCRASRGVCYFFPRPSAGSACKRLNLFLRWMVRRDAIDLGVWSKVVAGAS